MPQKKTKPVADGGTLETRNVADLTHWEDNPKDATPEAISRLAKQLQTLGQYKPLLVTKQGEVIGGNQRLKALKKLGVKKVLCHVVNPKSQAEKVQLAFSDNDNAGEWKHDALAKLVSEAGSGFPADDYAIDMGNIFAFAAPPEVERDVNTAGQSLQRYMEGNVKQIVVYGLKSEIAALKATLTAYCKKQKLTSSEQAITHLIEAYDAAQAA